jgi:hypothetical protein
MHFSSTVVIDAAPEDIWRVLVDLPAWPSWNTTVVRTEGTVAPGAKVAVTVTANPGRTFPVRVAELDEPRRMVWRGGMPLGLFTGTRTFALAAEGAGTRFSMDEVYTGPMAGLITRSIPDLQPGFDEFAACLKTRVESSERAS